MQRPNWFPGEMAAVWRLIDRLSGLPADATSPERYKARAILIWGVAVGAAGVVMAFLSSAIPYANTTNVAAIYIAVSGVLSSILVLRLTLSPQLAGLLLSVSVAGGLMTGPVFSEGVYSANLHLITASPVIVGFLVSDRACFRYTLFLLAYFPLLTVFGPTPAYLSADTALRLGLINSLTHMVGALGCGLATMAFAMSSRHAVRLLSDARTKSDANAKEADFARRRFADFVEVGSDWLWETDRNHRFEFVAGRFIDLAARRPDFFLGVKLDEVLTFRRRDRDRLDDALDRRTYYDGVTARFVDEGGEAYIIDLSAKPIFDDTGRFRGYRGVGRDVTARVRAEAQARFLARYDKLTGLANRRAFNAHLESLFERPRADGGGLALMAIDLDGFKEINDAYGHQAGDAVLQIAASRLRACLRKGDMAARLGGDEFALLTDGHSADSASMKILADRVVELLAEPYPYEGLELRLSASVGLAHYPTDAVTAEQLMSFADLALYDAKNGGKNRWRVFQPAMEQAVLRRRRLESDLRKALKERAFTVSYQPQFCLRTGDVVGLEALVRWVHPELGVVAPNIFVPVAEESGQINALGAAVLEMASRAAADWGPDAPRVCVNVSKLEFMEPQFPSQVAHLLEAAGLDASRLELEVGEDALLADVDLAARQLEALSEMGVAVAIDDFGTGFSSLKHLSRLRVARLKIDGSFVSRFEDEASLNVIRSIVQLGAALGLEVTAEGIETEAQFAALKQLGCRYGQGYLLAMPLAEAKVAAFLRAKGDEARPAA